MTPTPDPAAPPAAADLEFLFDVGSPNAYLCHKVLPALQARTGARVAYRPLLLGGLFKLANNRSPIEAYAAIPSKLAYERLELRRFVARHGLTAFRFNPHFPVDTLLAMRGAVAAQHAGCLPAYAERLFAAMWEQGLKVDEPSVVAGALAGSGVDADALLQAAQSPAVKAALLAATQAAHDRGAFGAPTFFVGNEMWFGKERLADVEAALSRRVRDPHDGSRPASP